MTHVLAFKAVMQRSLRDLVSVRALLIRHSRWVQTLRPPPALVQSRICNVKFMFLALNGRHKYGGWMTVPPPYFYCPKLLSYMLFCYDKPNQGLQNSVGDIFGHWTSAERACYAQMHTETISSIRAACVWHFGKRGQNPSLLRDNADPANWTT